MHDDLLIVVNVVFYVASVYLQTVFQQVTDSENSKRCIEHSNQTIAKSGVVNRWFGTEIKTVVLAI